MIEGMMPKWRQYFHRSACAFICLLFAAMGTLSLRIMTAATQKAPRILSIFFVVFAVAAITGMVRYLQTIISEFRYNGSKLAFRTVGSPVPRAVALADIISIQDWRGRGGQSGFRLQLRDRRKFYLEHSVSNSAALVNLLRTHMA